MKPDPHKLMIRSFMIFILVFAISSSSILQEKNSQPELINTIDLPDVKGRIDHLAYNPQQKIIYLAALGNNTIEVVDAQNNKVIHSIKGLNEPQGLRYIPDTHAIFVANGGGECIAYNSNNYQQISSINTGRDADNVRFSPESGKIYVGYGAGGIAVIDSKTFEQVADIKLPEHPESFQIDAKDKKLYVNVPDAHLIEVVDLDKNRISEKWKLEASSNFPMALDLEGNRLFIGCRNPAKLLVIDTETGKTIASLNIDSDTDDVFYDSSRKKIYVSCGGGYLDVIREINRNQYEVTSRVKTQQGARTSLFIPELNQIVIAAPARSGSQARLMVYRID